MSLRSKMSVDDIWPMSNKKVLVRVDFNVPIKNGIISNDYRIRSAIPTIKRIIDQGGICILVSHLGRPKGVKYSEVTQDDDLRRRTLHTWLKERGTGKTAYFAVLTAEQKLEILQKSSMADKVVGMTAKDGHGKTAMFTHLPEEEKKSLLDELTTKMRQEQEFPQLRQYQGFEEELSLRPVATRLEELMGQPVAFAHDCMDAQSEVDALKGGDIIILENCRFYSDEGSKNEADRMIIAEKLASYADYFVSDAFGTAHRDSATMTGVAKVLGHGAAGYLMDTEINYFSKVLGNPPRPMVAIVGGAKVSDKIQLLENMLPRIDKLLIGGAMAYTFLKAQGMSIGKSYCEAGQSFTDKYGEKQDIVSLAGALLEKAKASNVQVCLPIDHICHTECKATDSPLVTTDGNVPDGYMALDIGPLTLQRYASEIEQCKTAIWNGPMGVFEIPTYSAGTFGVAKCMADCTEKTGLLSIIGGGDSASAAETCGEAARMSHVSTGGGASLELLEGKLLPGITVLDDKK